MDQEELDRRVKAQEDRMGIGEETKRSDVEILTDALAAVKAQAEVTRSKTHRQFGMASAAKAAEEEAEQADKLVVEVQGLLERAKRAE